MVSRRGVSVDNNFIGGLITQATGLNFPENACIDTDNCIFNERGFVSRRPSFDFEANYQTQEIDRYGNALTTYLWKNASDDGTSTLVVTQVGSTLYFYIADSALGLSAFPLADTIDLTDFSPSGGDDPSIDECQFAAGIGHLFVAHPKLDPFAVVYDSGAGTVTGTKITITIRDFEGLDDSEVSVTDRPAALSDLHKYNLYNQGWDAAKVATFHTDLSAYPSNADIWWLFKDTTGVYTPAGMNANVSPGNARAPKGSFVLEAFKQDRSTVSGIAGFDIVSSGTKRPSAVAFYAGRVFYSGVDAFNYTGKIYFSQIIETNKQFGYCCQQSDPSSETTFDLLGSDGGVIRIPGTGAIYRMLNIGNNLLVFASHGVWMISGSTGIGFQASDYTVSFLASTRVISANSFVDIQGFPAWWNVDGIFVVRPNQQGALTIESLTDQKIKDFILDIPFLSKKQARGYYNPFTHIVQWVYRSTAAATVTDSYEYDSALNFNILSGAFYGWSFPESTVKIHGLVVAETGGGSLLDIFDIADQASELVLDQAGDQVITYGLGLGSTIHTTTKYLVSYLDSGVYKFTWAECADFRGDYTDWVTFDSVGVDYTSDFTTGFKVYTEGQRRFQENYIFVFSNNEESSEYNFQSLWDFANANDSGRWSSAQTITHNATFYNYIRKKIKVRGHGVAVQFKFSSVSGKAFDLIGWSTLTSAPADQAVSVYTGTKATIGR